MDNSRSSDNIYRCLFHIIKFMNRKEYQLLPDEVNAITRANVSIEGVPTKNTDEVWKKIGERLQINIRTAIVLTNEGLISAEPLSELIDKPIIAGCPEGGIVLDPFCGTGTTLKRAKQLGRNVIGIEGKKEYVDLANKIFSTVENRLF